MPASQDPRNGIWFGFDLGEQDWNEKMNDNLRLLSRVGFHLMVTSRSLQSPPGDVSSGDTYIVAVGGSGEWNGLDNQVVVYAPGEASNDWIEYVPRKGWMAFIDDEEVISVFKDDSNGWSPGVAI